MLKRIVFILVFSYVLAQECLHKDFGNGGTVCVCNNDHCDTINPVESLAKGKYVSYTSNLAGLRFEKNIADFNTSTENKKYVINVDSSISYQNIFGWGGAFTDSAGININSLTGKAREHLLNSYFSNKGLEYNLCRVPIGGTDFSTHPYTYDDVTNDIGLEHFNLTQEDINYKIPLIQEALKLTGNKLKLFGSAWSAPIWMKSNNAISGVGFLKSDMYQAWADYHLKFLEAYQKEGINFWAITTGNEPANGYIPIVKINSMGWTPSGLSKWISNNLGPTIKNSSFSDIKIITLDDQIFFLPWLLREILKDQRTRDYVDGIGVHWYWNHIFPHSLLTTTHNTYPDKFILATEACVGDKFYQKSVELGSWKRGEMYAKDIIQDTNNYVTGWIDWNMALDLTGGPTYIDNNVDSPIIVNATGQEFYKQPMYYTLGHFSKFVPPNSTRIKSSVNTKNLYVTAFSRSDGGRVLVILNTKSSDAEVTIKDNEKGSINLSVTKRSINTILYW